MRGNVAFGVEDGLIYDAMVWDALAMAQLADFVSELPYGLYTVVVERMACASPAASASDWPLLALSTSRPGADLG